MQTREDYIAGVPCYVDTARSDPQAALDFYGGLFGWEFENVSPNGAPSYFMAKLHDRRGGGASARSRARTGRCGTPTCAWRAPTRRAAKVAEAGGRVDTDPFDIGPAGRLAYFTDPEGASFAIWEPGQTRGVQLVNDPGAWVSSELNTRDPGGAAAFYRAVFGWETAPLG